MLLLLPSLLLLLLLLLLLPIATRTKGSHPKARTQELSRRR
jgi:hypothetical protein